MRATRDDSDETRRAGTISARQQQQCCSRAQSHTDQPDKRAAYAIASDTVGMAIDVKTITAARASRELKT